MQQPTAWTANIKHKASIQFPIMSTRQGNINEHLSKHCCYRAIHLVIFSFFSLYLMFERVFNLLVMVLLVSTHFRHFIREPIEPQKNWCERAKRLPFSLCGTNRKWRKLEERKNWINESLKENHHLKKMSNIQRQKPSQTKW